MIFPLYKSIWHICTKYLNDMKKKSSVLHAPELLLKYN